MMNGMAMGPMLLLIIAVGGLILLLTRVGRGQRRRGGMLVAGAFLMTGLLLFGILLPRAANSQAMAEHDRAVAMRDQALQQEIMLRQSMATAPHIALPIVPRDPGAEDDEDQADESDGERMDSVVDEINNEVTAEVEAIDSKVKATVRGVEVHTQRYVPPGRSTQVDWQPSRSGLPNRSTRAQVVTGIMLGGVVLAGYFFLNANTRGHYTWRLRIGSTLVFVASLAVIILISMH